MTSISFIFKKTALLSCLLLLPLTLAYGHNGGGGGGGGHYHGGGASGGWHGGGWHGNEWHDGWHAEGWHNPGWHHDYYYYGGGGYYGPYYGSGVNIGIGINSDPYYDGYQYAPTYNYYLNSSDPYDTSDSQ